MSLDSAVAASLMAPMATRFADFVELTKARIAVLVLATVAAGYMLGCGSQFEVSTLAAALFGTALVAAASSVVNQVIERDVDARMHRTRNRPLPTGRISVQEARWFAWILALTGLLILWTATNPTTTALAAVSFVLYVWVYTPLKGITVANTAIGAIPGALPTVIGWSAATGGVETPAWWLFAVVYLWQFPHFYAIAWLFREDYELGGLKMLPTTELGLRTVGLQAVSYCLALLPVSLLPLAIEGIGAAYGIAATGLGLYFLGFAIAFAASATRQSARSLMFSSLVYLPTLLGMLMVDLARG